MSFDYQDLGQNLGNLGRCILQTKYCQVPSCSPNTCEYITTGDMNCRPTESTCNYPTDWKCVLSTLCKPYTCLSGTMIDVHTHAIASLKETILELRRAQAEAVFHQKHGLKAYRDRLDAERLRVEREIDEADRDGDILEPEDKDQ